MSNRSTAKSLTSGSPIRLLLAFTAPLLIGNLFQQFYQITDAAVVGRVIGTDGLAAVGASGGIIFLLFGLIWGSSSGVAIPVARAFGAENQTEMRTMVAAGTYVALGVVAVVTAVGLALASFTLRLMGTPPELLAGANTYLTITVAGAIATMAYNYLGAIIRAVGDSKTPLYFLIAASVLNAILTIALVAGAHLGVGAAAAGTVIAQAAAALGCAVFIRQRIPELVPRRADWRAGMRAMEEPLHLGIPMGLQLSVVGIGSILLQTAVNGLGTNAVAGFAAGFRVENIAVAMLSPLGIAITTYVAQNRGAQEWDRIRQGVNGALKVAAIGAVSIGFLLFALAPVLVTLFVGNAANEVAAFANTYIRVNATLYWTLAIMIVLRSAIQGFGQSGIPVVASVGEVIARAVGGFFLVRFIAFLGIPFASSGAWIIAMLICLPGWLRIRHQLTSDAANQRATVG
jgi:putative MATE family efflux protein